MIYNELIDRLMQHYSSEKFHDEVSAAKLEFSDRAGILDEASDDFDMKLTQFVDWYLFTRNLNDLNKTPIAQCFEDSNFSMSDDERLLFENLNSNKHGLFEFIKLSKKDLHIKDLFSNYRMVIKDSPVTVGFTKGEIFEARLIPHGDSFIFSQAYCFHPPQANKFIFKEIKNLNKKSEEDQRQLREELMLRLYRMRYKYDQYQHVNLDAIYTDEPKLRLR